jgi:hypothetical protein
MGGKMQFTAVKGKRVRNALASLLTLLFILAIGNIASAATLYQHDLDATLSGAYSNLGGWINADNFTLSTDAVITGVNWYGYYNSEPASSSSILFDLNFHSDVGNLPDLVPIYSQSLSLSITDIGIDAINGNNIYRFEAALATSFAVSAGERMWLSVFDTDPSTSQWLWSRHLPTGDGFAIRNTNPELITDWIPEGGGDLAFELVGDPVPIPEPATMILFGLGMAGVGIFRRFRK